MNNDRVKPIRRYRQSMNSSHAVSDSAVKGENKEDTNGGVVNPKSLKVIAEITLNTGMAVSMMTSKKDTREDKYRRGLLQFAEKIQVVEHASKKDDPYADAVLISVENKISDLDIRLKQYKEELQSVIGENSIFAGSFNIQSGSIEPVVFPIDFASTYSWLMLRLLKECDDIHCLAFSAKHVGLLDVDHFGQYLKNNNMIPLEIFRFYTSKTMNQFFDIIRATFAYQNTGVTRNDVATNNQRARDAAMKFKTPVKEILEDTLKPKYATWKR